MNNSFTDTYDITLDITIIIIIIIIIVVRRGAVFHRFQRSSTRSECQHRPVSPVPGWVTTRVFSDYRTHARAVSNQPYVTSPTVRTS